MHASESRLTWISSICLVLSCLVACGLRPSQQADVAQWEAEAAQLGHPEVRYVEYLDPGTALGLGFLPLGIGGFYVHRPGLAVSGILCWPLSMTWEPAVAYSSAEQYNYRELRARISSLREAAAARRPAPSDPGASLDRLEDLRRQGKISEAEYLDSRRRILERLGAPPGEVR